MTGSFLAKRVSGVKPPATREMTRLGNELARSGRSIVSLAQGEPDFDTPVHIREAAKAAIDAGKTRYTDVPGTRELAEAVVRKFERDHGLRFTTAQITIGVGSKQILYNALQATVDPGDEVLVPTPAWVSYMDMVMLAGGTPVILRCPAAQGFKVTPEQVERAITPRTKWLMLNSPSNPSGAEYTREELMALAKVLARHPHVWFMSDDIYEKIRYRDEPFATMAAVVPELASRCLTINGVSKAFAMTGWRCGYGAGPETLIRAVNLVQGQSVSHTSSVTQAAAVAALDGPMDFLPPFVAAYRRRRDLVVAANESDPGAYVHGARRRVLRLSGVPGASRAHVAEGAQDRDRSGPVHLLPRRGGRRLVPGSAFELPGHFRISYAAADTELAEGMKRITQACADLK
jgi:aspartate aminotransferase